MAFKTSLGSRFSDTVSCLCGWWAQLKEDCDKNPDQKREPKDLTPEDALHSFYVECKSELIDPARADEIRAKMLAFIGQVRAETGWSFGSEALASDRNRYATGNMGWRLQRT